MSIANPTAREMFLSAGATVVDDGNRHQMEDRFFFNLRLPNGTKKTTYRHRLDDIALLCNRLLAGIPAETLHLMDIAISSGVTTAEWMEVLDKLGRSYRMDANDLCLHGKVESLSEHLHVLRDSTGTPLQFEIFGWALANHYGYGLRSGMKRALPVSLARMMFAVGSRVRQEQVRSSARSVLLVTRDLRPSVRLDLQEADIFRLGATGRTYHLIRAANILNFAYFSAPQLSEILRQLVLCMHTGSYLVVVRTRDDRTRNDGTVFVKDDAGRLAVAERIGTGSEVEPIALGLTVTEPGRGERNGTGGPGSGETKRTTSGL